MFAPEIVLVTFLISFFSIMGYIIVSKHKPYVYYVNPNDMPVKLLYNKDVIDPTFKQLVEFLEIDQTEKLKYIPGKFVCSNFAETLQHNAAKAGLRCGWVAINFRNGAPSHACNVFNTVDRGLVFVDCTNSESGEGYDTIVDLSLRKIYQSRGILNEEIKHIPMGEVSGYRIFW